MTNDKAREYFSAYHEGALEPGLRTSLERKLRSDAALQAEYDAFVGTLNSLDALRHEAIEVPFYLSDRIAARLDGALTTKPAPFWSAWFKPTPAGPGYGYALGLAGALLVAAFGLRGMQATGEAQEANMGPGSPFSPVTVRWMASDEGLVAQFAGGPARSVTVAPEGGDATNYALAARQPFELTLNNPNSYARRFKVSQGSDLLATVAVPGARTAPRKSGSGTVSELASALADAYHIVVVVKGTPIGTTVAWKFDGVNARAAAEASLDGHGSASLMDGNVLQISP